MPDGEIKRSGGEIEWGKSNSVRPECSGKSEAMKIRRDLQRRVTVSQVRRWTKVFPVREHRFTKSQRSEDSKDYHRAVRGPS